MKDHSYTALSLSVDAGIARITFIRPDLHNRFDEVLHEEFPRVIEELVPRPDLVAVVLCSEGKSFSAGGDFGMMLKANRDEVLRRRLEDEARRIFSGLLSLPVPVIAAVQGAAIGLGASIVAMSDIVVAYREAVIADPHVAVGLVAGDGGVAAWAASIGVHRAKRYLLTGESATAEQLRDMGMVTDLVEDEDMVLPHAMSIAEKLASLPRGGVQGTKRAFSQLISHYTGNVFEYALQEEMRTMAGAELEQTVAKVMKT